MRKNRRLSLDKSVIPSAIAKYTLIDLMEFLGIFTCSSLLITSPSFKAKLLLIVRYLKKSYLLRF